MIMVPTEQKHQYFSQDWGRDDSISDAGGITGGAALASSLNLDLGVHSYFRGSTDEDSYGSVRLQPLLFVDDLMSSKDVSSTRAGNVKLDAVMKEKFLQIHPVKSGFLLISNEKFKANVRIEAAESPIMCGEIETKERLVESYLGDKISNIGLVASVEATIKDREAQIKGSIF